jgi:haloalkane dehalogenase
MTGAAEWRARKRCIAGSDLAYVETGDGPPIVLLHGNPTSSFLWRRVVGHLEGLGRCIVPDLLGMGDSAKLPQPGPGSYRFVEHRRHLDELLRRLDVTDDVTFVVHDWGSALGFDWANRHRDGVRGLAYSEAFVRPLRWEEWPQVAAGIFQAMRSDAGESLILERNLFVERILPASVLTPLSPEAFAEYRRPFAAAGEDRRPTLTWPREIPLDGEPADVAEIVGAYADWLARAEVPKLFINAEPGSILIGAQRDFCRTWPNQREITVAASHFVPEDAGDEMGRAIAAWLTGLRR